MSFDPLDCYEHGVESDCCGARIMLGDICSECGEHCDAAEDEDDFPPAPSSDVPMPANLRCHRTGGLALRDQLITHSQTQPRTYMPTQNEAQRTAMQAHVDAVNKSSRESYDYAVANSARNIENARTNLNATIKNAVDLAGRTIAGEQARLNALGQPKVVTVADLFGTEVA